MPVDVGLKYCGGCNPSFDRGRLVETIAERLTGLIRLVPYRDPSIRHVLIVAGCESACVERVPFAGKQVHLIFRPRDLERVVRELTVIAKGNNR